MNKGSNSEFVKAVQRDAYEEKSIAFRIVRRVRKIMISSYKVVQI